MKRLSIYTIYILLTCSMIIMWSCGEEVTPPINTQGNITFSAIGTFGSNALTLEAGQNDVYLYTDYTINQQNIIELQGNFAKLPSCTTNCQENLAISISNNQTGNNLSITDALSVGDYIFVSPVLDSLTRYETTFQSFATANSVISATWRFDDVVFSNELAPVFIFDNDNPLIELETKDIFGNKSSIKTHLDLDNNTNCQTDFFFHYQPSQGIYTFKPLVNNPNLAHQWTLTDGINLTQHTGSTFPTSINSSDLFEVCLEINDNGCESKMCKLFSNHSNTLVAASTFSFDSQGFKVLDINNLLSKALITYTAPNGSRYSTDNGEQATNSYFQITSVEDYIDNENGLATQKITANVQCQLFDESGNSELLKIDSLVFAVAYP